MKRCLACLAVAILSCSITGIPAQDDASQTGPTEAPEDQKFKVQTDLMEVRAVVTDRDGRVVENLTKDDFELLENNQPQEISFFSVSQVESERSGRAAVKETEAPPQAVGPKGVQERLIEPPVRTTLLYVDTLHLSFSSLNSVKQALRSFINERLTEQDLVALATSSQTLGVAQQFTRDRQLLDYAVEQIRLDRTRPETLFTPNLAADIISYREEAMRLAVDIVRQEERVECPCSMLRGLAYGRALQILTEDSYYRQNTLPILRGFAEQMIDLPGKRMIVVFSDGFSMRDVRGEIYHDEIRSVINRAVRSGVVIYSIDAKGLRPPPTIDASFGRTDANAFGGPEIITYNEGEEDEISVSGRCPNETPPDPGCFAPNPGQLAASVNMFEREKLDGLHEMALETGGKMFTDTNDLGGALGRAFDANRFYYVLSYYLPPIGDSDQFRNIEVRVRDHPEYTVLAPRGYSPADAKARQLAEAAKTPQQRLLQAMNAPLPVTDLGVSAQADFLETETDDKQASLTVYFDGDRFQYREQDQRNAFELEILYVVYDSSGKQVEGKSARVEGSLSQDRLTQAKTSGYRFSRRLTLEPGVYQVRVGVREEGTDRMGTATAWIDVPELKREVLEMSSLILSNPLDIDHDDAEGINVSELEQIKMVQSIPLFGRGDFFDYSFRVYQDTLSFMEPDLAWMPELLLGGKPIKQEQWLPISVEKEDIDSKGWFDVYGEVDLGELGSGVYELRVNVKDSRSNKTVQRTTVFSVE